MPDPVIPANTPAPDAKGVETPAEKPQGSVLAGATDAPAKAETPAVGSEKAKTPEAPGAKPEAKEPEKKADEVVLKLPEGFNADPVLLGEFKELTKAEGLKPEVAQKLVDFQAKIVANQKAAADKEAKEFADKDAAWRAEALKIPAAELGLAKRAMINLTKDLPEALRDETRAILQDTWMGNHPGVLRVLAAAGKFLAEDKVVEGGSQGSAPFSAAKDFYSASKMK